MNEARALILGCIVLVLFTAGFALGCRTAHAVDAKTLQRVRNEHAAVLADLNTKVQAARQAVRAYEHAAQDAYMAQSKRYEQEKLDAFDTGKDFGARIARGELRLRPQWQCPTPARAGVPATAAVPGQPDDAAELRAADLGRVRGIAEACDAHVRNLQALDPNPVTGLPAEPQVR